MFTITNDITNEIIIKNSRFICIIHKIYDVNDINNYLNNIKSEYKDATHYCYAYIIDDKKKFSDDGEPSGTAGNPMLQALDKNNLNYVLCVVIRYFGGIKLGAGGLVRAYTKSITQCLEKANIRKLVYGYNIDITFNYEYANNVLNGTIKNDSFLPVLYELDKTEEWKDIKCWAKANPGIGTIKQYKYLTEQVQRAKDDLSSKKGILCKDFNIRSTSEEKWLDFDIVNNEETFDIENLRGSYAIGGADLSSTTDLTCATLLILKKQKIYVIQHYFIPEDKIEEKENEDDAPYKIWQERGLLTACTGAKVNYNDVTKWFLKMHREKDISTLWVGYDPWGSTYWVNEMKEEGFEMEEVIQGAKTMSNPMKQLEADLKEKKVNYNNNPMTKWCLLNTSVKIDENDNIRPVKGKKSKQRIDGAVSLIDAYVILYRKMQDYLVLQEE